MRGSYVALHLSKMNAAEKGSTVLLERRQATEPGGGFLCPHPDSERILAVIQGEAAVLKLNRRDSVLLAIAEAGGLAKLDQKAAATLIWPDSENPKGQWDKALSALRKSGFISDLSITEAGWAKAETLGYTPSARKAPQVPDPTREPKTQRLPPGRSGAEGPEENPSFPSGGLGERNGRKDSGMGDPFLPAVSGDAYTVDL